MTEATRPVRALDRRAPIVAPHRNGIGLLRAAQIVRDAFGGARAVLWTTATGPGTINMRRRGIHGGITMSIAIAPRPDGGSRVAMRASETVVYFGFLVNFAGEVNGRKNAIERLLKAAEVTTAETDGRAG